MSLEWTQTSYLHSVSVTQMTRTKTTSHHPFRPLLSSFSSFLFFSFVHLFVKKICHRSWDWHNFLHYILPSLTIKVNLLASTFPKLLLPLNGFRPYTDYTTLPRFVPVHRPCTLVPLLPVHYSRPFSTPVQYLLDKLPLTKRRGHIFITLGELSVVTVKNIKYNTKWNRFSKRRQ